MNGALQQQPLREILAHLFNHQTHHRGQAHAALTALGIAEPVALDLLIMQRECLKASTRACRQPGEPVSPAPARARGKAGSVPV